MRALPSAIEVEVELLGIILESPKFLVECVNDIKIDDFYKQQHRAIYTSICNLFAEGKDITLITVAENLGKERLSKIGGLTYLADLITNKGTYSTAKSLIEIIKDKSTRRKAILSAKSAIEELEKDNLKTNEILGKLQNELTEKSSKNGIIKDDELLLKTLTSVEKRVQAGGELPGMSTGFKKFDKATNGLKKGEFVVVGGRPSMGKTLIALNIGDGLAKNGHKVGIIEMEMTEESLGLRRMAYTALIEANKLQTGKLTDDEFINLSKAYNALAKRNNILTDCSDYQNILTIKAKAKAMKQINGLDVLIIDHLGLMDIKEGNNRAYAIGEVTRQLKLLAKELDINIILLCQLSRAVEQRADKRPMLSDLRESGNIEQDADLVMFAYRDAYYNPETEDKNVMEWIIAKQRNGCTGTLKFSYIDKYQLIGDLDFRG